MNLYEFQAKEILARRGVPVPAGHVAQTAEEAGAVAHDLDAPRFVIKAQIQAGGRGEAGGVHFGATGDAVKKIAGNLLGSRLVTSQTGGEGRVVRRVYVEEAVAAAREVYVGALVDLRLGRLVLVGAREGGGDIEARIARDPSILETLPLDGTAKPEPAAIEAFVARLGLEGEAGERTAALYGKLAAALVELDAGLIEINPLAVTADGAICAVDVKMVLDDSALYRHPELAALEEEDDRDAVELEAQRHDINFVRMDGDIGVVVNGAGLGLATHDLLRDHGGKPANFMDIRTTATSLQIAKGIDLLLANPAVKAILVNVHGGGMTRCDTIVEALNVALRRSNRTLPIVFRVAGQAAEQARRMMVDRRIPHERVDDMTEACARAVELAGGKR